MVNKFLFFIAACSLLFTADAWAQFGRQQQQPPQVFTQFQNVPARSFMATVDDVNYIPEGDFMMRADSLNYDMNIQLAQQTESMMFPGVQFATRPVVVCRDHGCTMLNDRITRTFLFNSLSNMFLVNQHSRMSICEADPFTRACLQSGISFPVRAGVASALVRIPRASINSVTLSPGLSRTTVGLTYEFQVNGIDVRCEPTSADIVVPANTNAMLITREFSCRMTTDGLTSASLLINLDYIDLDYGILGGYYSFGLQGPTAGGGTGYALFRTEHTSRGPSASTSGRGSERGMNQIRPGEYAVEPLEQRDR
jgi:hypothetical protein